MIIKKNNKNIVNNKIILRKIQIIKVVIMCISKKIFKKYQITSNNNKMKKIVEIIIIKIIQIINKIMRKIIIKMIYNLIIYKNNFKMII